MNLSLVKKAEFNGVECDFYNQEENKDVYMTREQIGKALGYSFPREAIQKIHERNKDRLSKYSREVKLTSVEGNRTIEREITIYSPKGIYEICRWSRQPKADAFMDFVWEVIEKLRTGKVEPTLDMDMIKFVVTETVVQITTQIVPMILKNFTGGGNNPSPSPSPSPSTNVHNEYNINVPNSKRRAYPKMYFLPDDIKLEVDQKLLMMERYEDISSYLRNKGYAVSRSVIGRYAIETGLNTPKYGS